MRNLPLFNQTTRALCVFVLCCIAATCSMAQFTLSVESTSIASNCQSAADGGVVLDVTGTTPSSYMWSDGVTNTSSTRTDLGAGNYSVTATDGTNTATADFTIICTILCGEYNMTMDSDCTTDLSPSNFGGNDDIHVLVLKKGFNVLASGATVTSNEIGKTITYEINYKTGGNACWKTFVVEDKSAPLMDCPADIDVLCFQSLDTTVTGGPRNVSDCSGVPTIDYSDDVLDLVCGNNALDFDGVDDYVSFTSLASTEVDDISIELWANWDGTGQTIQRIIYNGNSSISGYGLYLNGGQLSLLLGGVALTPIAAMPVNSWTHLALIRNSGSWSVYMNGEDTGFSNAGTPNVPTTQLSIGGRAASLTEAFSGLIDEARIWERAISEGDIQDNLNRELSGDEADLVAYYKFNEGVANSANTAVTLPDATANSKNGTLNNFGLAAGAVSNWTLDRLLSNDFQSIITRTFTATDANGYSTSCEQQIRIRRASLDHVSFPENVEILCSALDDDATDPSNTGYPTWDPDGDAGPIKPINITVDGAEIGACMLRSWMQEDQVVFECGATRKILRTWRVINMCEEGVPNVLLPADADHTQLIVIKHDDPQFVELADYSIRADNTKRTNVHAKCRSTAPLQSAEHMPLCEGQTVSDITIWIPYLGQEIANGAGADPGLPMGVHEVFYRMTDECSNVMTEMKVLVTVYDDSAPVCDLEDYVTRYLPEPELEISIDAEEFDDDGGSWDNCSNEIFFLVRRTGSNEEYDETADFDCDDLPSGMIDTISMEILLLDLDPEDPDNYSPAVVKKDEFGRPSDPEYLGNFTECWSDVILRSSVTPMFSCPDPALTLTCEEFNDPNADFGSPVITSTCGMDAANTTARNDTTITCESVVITRSHFSEDGDLVCTQELTIIDPLLTITGPSDVDDLPCADYSCENRPDPNDTGRPSLSGTSCIRQTPEFIFTDSQVCDVTDGILSFTRTWTVDPASDTLNCYNDFSYDQEITTQANCCLDPQSGFIRFNSISIEVELIDDVSASDFGDANAPYSIVWFLGTDLMGTPIAGYTTILAENLDPETEYSWLITQNNDNSACIFSGSQETRGAALVGDVTNEFGLPIQDVRVALESNQAARVIGKDEIMSEVMTDESGKFEFGDVDLPSLNRLTLVKDGDDRDNISTRDIIIMARHILGIKEITSPYSYIAADLTGNGKISTADMLLMQKIVLGIEDEMPNNSSWRFVKEDHVFDDMNTILDYNFPEYFTFTGEETAEELQDLNFIAVKIGDLAGAYGAELQGGNSTTKTLSLQTDNQQLLPGAIIEVPIRAGEAKRLSGYQHAYQFDTEKLVFTGIDYGKELKLDDNNFGYRHLGDGFLTTNWYDTEDKNIESGAVIYTLKFEVRAAAQLSDVLAMSSEYTQAEAYFDTDKVGGVQFTFNNTIGDQLVVMNAPNPFKESTQVRFEAPNKGFALIRVTDVSGRAVYTTELQAVKGENQVVINKSDLEAAGIYILKIDLNGSSATQKIVMME